MKVSNPMQVVILIGPPGAGKGTQAELLSEKLNLYYFETSKLLEAKFANAEKGDFMEVGGVKYFFEDEKKLWETGILCSPPFVTAVVKEKLQEIFKEGKSLLFAGSPRTLYEGKEEMPFLAKLYGKINIHIILLDLTEDQSIYRNSHRRICELMRHPVLYSPETAALTMCPLDGSTLVAREGLDDAQTIKVRLREYRERTFPLIAYFQEQGFKVYEINADQTVAKVFFDILSELSKSE